MYDNLHKRSIAVLFLVNVIFISVAQWPAGSIQM